MQKTKTISWNDKNIRSIKNAEKMKTRLENKGYSLIKTTQIDIDNWVITYQK